MPSVTFFSLTSGVSPTSSANDSTMAATSEPPGRHPDRRGRMIASLRVAVSSIGRRHIDRNLFAWPSRARQMRRWKRVSALDLRLLGRLGGAGLLAGAVALFALMALPGGMPWGHAQRHRGRRSRSRRAGRPSRPLERGRHPRRHGAGRRRLRSRSAWPRFSGGSQATYGPLFVVVSAWCGMALGPAYTFKLAPLALLCATLPAWLGQPGTALTGFGSVTIATVTGEIFARLADRARRDARRDAERTHALELLTAGQLALAQSHDPREAAGIAAKVARDILDAERTAMLLGPRRRPSRARQMPAGRPERIEPWEQAIWTDEDVFTVSLKGRDGTGVRGRPHRPAASRPAVRPLRKALVASLAAATSAALESIALKRRLRVRAEVDPLTGLGNRRRLDAALARLRRRRRDHRARPRPLQAGQRHARP